MTDRVGGAIPLAQAVDEYLDWQALDKACSPNTVRAYKQHLAIFLTGDVTTLAQIDRELLRAYQSDLARGPGRTVVLSAPTRHRRLVALRSFLKFCAREEWSPGDLGVTIDLPNLPRRLPKPLDEAELGRTTADTAVGVELDTAGLCDRPLAAFLISTGCRISEALALDRTDWNTHRVIVRGKGDVERSVVITEQARTEVDAYLKARTDAAPALFRQLLPGKGRPTIVRARSRSRVRPPRRYQSGHQAASAQVPLHRRNHCPRGIGRPRLTADSRPPRPPWPSRRLHRSQSYPLRRSR